MDEDDNELGINLNDFDSRIQIEFSKSKKNNHYNNCHYFCTINYCSNLFIIFLPQKINKVSYEIICKFKIQDIYIETGILSENFN